MTMLALATYVDPTGSGMLPTSSRPASSAKPRLSFKKAKARDNMKGRLQIHLELSAFIAYDVAEG